MKRISNYEIRVGLTVIVGLLILLFGFAYFKGWTLTDSLQHITIRFPTSAGLQKGDQVSINGVKSGKVESVMLNGAAVDVKVALQNDAVLWTDARATIQMLELMGGKQVAIMRGNSGFPYDASHVMTGSVDPDIAGALEMIGELGTTARGIPGKVDTLLDNANALIGDKQMAASLREAVENFRAVSSDLRGLLADNKANVRLITSDMVNLTRRLDTVLAMVQPFVRDLPGTTTRLAGKADTLLSDVQELVRDVRDSRGMVHKLLHDATLNSRLDVLLQRLDSLTSLLVDGDLRVRVKFF